MISLEEFKALRLNQFTKGGITALPSRELFAQDWTGEAAGTWTNEALGPIEFLRPIDQPEETKVVVLDFNSAPEELCQRVLAVLGLELRQGMSQSQIEERLGRPLKLHTIGDKGVAPLYKWRGVSEFNVMCVVWREGGLSQVIVSTP